MNIIITFDLDHISCNNKYYEKTNISFDYVNILHELYDFLDKKPFTAFVRIDKQIKNIFGDYLYVLNLLPKTANIGWHPHLIEGIPEIYEIYPTVRSMSCVRIGGCVMNNQIMKTLSDLGFHIDSTALPGCTRNDIHRKFDWSITGNTPYHPFIEDYQCSGDPHHQILEVPMTTIPIIAPYDQKVQRRYINPTMRQEIFQPAFAHCCNYLTSAVIVFHPDQLIHGYEDDLYLYGMDNFKANMKFIDSSVEAEYVCLK